MVRFRLYSDQLAFIGLDGKLTVEPGEFSVLIGSSSRTSITDTFTVTGLRKVAYARKYFSEVTVE